MYVCVLHTMGGSITQWAALLSTITMYVCVAHIGRVYQTVSWYILKKSYVCVSVAHNGQVYHTVGGYIFKKSYVCVLQTMGRYITQWAGMFSTFHMYVCVLHTVGAYIFKTFYVCVCCTQWTGLSLSGLVCLQKSICVCAAHNERVHHTVGGYMFNTPMYVCGRVYHTVGGYTFNKSFVCVCCTQWAGLYTKIHMYVCAAHNGRFYFQNVVHVW